VSSRPPSPPAKSPPPICRGRTTPEPPAEQRRPAEAAEALLALTVGLGKGESWGFVGEAAELKIKLLWLGGATGDFASQRRSRAPARGEQHANPGARQGLQLRTERRLRGLLREMPKHNGTGKISDLGIERKQSHRWQQLAATKAPVFERTLRR
jgi:hypothetical protein